METETYCVNERKVAVWPDHDYLDTIIFHVPKDVKDLKITMFRSNGENFNMGNVPMPEDGFLEGERKPIQFIFYGDFEKDLKEHSLANFRTHVYLNKGRPYTFLIHKDHLRISVDRKIHEKFFQCYFGIYLPNRGGALLGGFDYLTIGELTPVSISILGENEQ